MTNSTTTTQPKPEYFTTATAHRGIVGDVDLAEDPADFFGNGFALGFVHVEDGDPHTVAGKQTNRGFAEAGGPACDNRGNRGIEFHGRFAPVLVRLEP